MLTGGVTGNRFSAQLQSPPVVILEGLCEESIIPMKRCIWSSFPRLTVPSWVARCWPTCLTSSQLGAQLVSSASQVWEWASIRARCDVTWEGLSHHLSHSHTAPLPPKVSCKPYHERNYTHFTHMYAAGSPRLTQNNQVYFWRLCRLAQECTVPEARYKISRIILTKDSRNDSSFNFHWLKKIGLNMHLVKWLAIAWMLNQ